VKTYKLLIFKKQLAPVERTFGERNHTAELYNAIYQPTLEENDERKSDKAA
jgi:hypothetical protein